MSAHVERGGYVVMQQFMIEDLGLTGDELIVYAIIFGFCQDGKSYCHCSRNYFSFWVGKSKRSVSRILDSLCDRGLIVREHEIVDGQTLPRYRLGQDAPGVAIEHVEVVPFESEDHSSLPLSSVKGGAPAHPPCQGDSDSFGVSAVGRGVRQRTPLVTGAPPVSICHADTDTDSLTDSESESDRGRAGAHHDSDPSFAALRDEFFSLKTHMPSTDGYGYAFENYRTLRGCGFSFEEIAHAADLLTKAIRADYPDRPACFLPHAERLLDLGNAQGIGRFLDRSRLRKAAIPSDGQLFTFAVTNDVGDLGREAERLNDEIVRAEDEEAKNAARKVRNDWLAEHRDALVGAWRSKKGA